MYSPASQHSSKIRLIFNFYHPLATTIVCCYYKTIVINSLLTTILRITLILLRISWSNVPNKSLSAMLSQRIHIQQKLCMYLRCVLIILSLCTNTALDSISSYILLYSPEASQRSIKLGITVFIRSLSPVKLGVSDVICHFQVTSNRPES